jgi:hypothetical protein
MLVLSNLKQYIGYFLAAVGALCGLIVTIQLAILEFNWIYFPTRDYQPGTITGAIDIYYRLVEAYQLLMSPTCLPYIIVGIVCALSSRTLLNDIDANSCK